MNDMTKQFEQFAEFMKAAMPTVKPNKNGYEIRTKVLEFAQNQVWQDFQSGVPLKPVFQKKMAKLLPRLQCQMLQALRKY